MNVRTGILLGIMTLVVVAWAGDQFGLLSFLDGSGQAESELDTVNRQISKAEEIIHQGVIADTVLTVLQQRSLPYDPAEARSAYQAWLTSLVNSNDITKSSVEVSSPTPVSIKAASGKSKEAYKRYGFTLNGVGSLENITQFLFAFYRAGHLHKITSLALTPSSRGMFAISVAGEALGVSSCDRKLELSVADGTSMFETADEYAQIVRRNIFSREGGKTLKQVSLSSITFDKLGQPEAWFKVGPSKATKRLQRNGVLDVSVHRIKIVDIQPRSAMIEVDGTMLTLPIGKNIQEVRAGSGEADQANR